MRSRTPRSDRKYSVAPCHSGCVSVLFSPGTFCDVFDSRSNSQMSVVNPPRYRFHVRKSPVWCVYASVLPSGAIAPNSPNGTGSVSGSPPLADTRNSLLNRSFSLVRVDANRMRPSALHSMTRSASGWNVIRSAAPPIVGIT